MCLGKGHVTCCLWEILFASHSSSFAAGVVAGMRGAPANYQLVKVALDAAGVGACVGGGGGGVGVGGGGGGGGDGSSASAPLFRSLFLSPWIPCTATIFLESVEAIECRAPWSF